MSERQPGWYWVKLCDNWECARWTGATWRRGNVTTCTRDEAFSEIGPRIPTPDEPWQTVPVEATREMVEAAMSRGAVFGFGAHYQGALKVAPNPGGE